MTNASPARTLASFLIGRRDAIERIAVSRSATVASFVFVLTAGIAREYDGEYLLAEPWHALRPLGASAVTGTVLFLLVRLATFRRGATDGPGLAESYRRFMTCFWMTAPLAWLYAIPYERFLSPGDAVMANLWTLALVAAWRVLLITKVAAVLTGSRTIPMFFIVMLFSDAVAFAVFAFIPVPVMDFMGGMQHTERDALLASTAFLMQFLTVLSAPVWILGAIAAVSSLTPAPPRFDAAPIPARDWNPLLAASVLIWIAPLIIAQPEQARRHRVDQLFASGDTPAALAELSKHPESFYPRRWELPPRLGYREETPDLDAVREVIDTQPTAEWVAAAYADKIDRQLMRRFMPFSSSWADALDAINRAYPPEFERRAGFSDLTEHDLDQLRFVANHLARLTPEDRAAMEILAARLRDHLDIPPDADAPLPPPAPNDASEEIP
tara:strand:+ start:941 stop:2260 length:1320 start_codon:yes stop_codon:yes gene_type:complete